MVADILVYVCVADHFHEHQTLMACTASALSSADLGRDPFSKNIWKESTSSASNKELFQSTNGLFDQYVSFSSVNAKVERVEMGGIRIH